MSNKKLKMVKADKQKMDGYGVSMNFVHKTLALFKSWFKRSPDKTCGCIVVCRCGKSLAQYLDESGELFVVKDVDHLLEVTGWKEVKGRWYCPACLARFVEIYGQKEFDLVHSGNCVDILPKS